MKKKNNNYDELIENMLSIMLFYYLMRCFENEKTNNDGLPTLSFSNLNNEDDKRIKIGIAKNICDRLMQYLLREQELLKNKIDFNELKSISSNQIKESINYNEDKLQAIVNNLGIQFDIDVYKTLLDSFVQLIKDRIDSIILRGEAEELADDEQFEISLKTEKNVGSINKTDGGSAKVSSSKLIEFIITTKYIFYFRMLGLEYIKDDSTFTKQFIDRWYYEIIKILNFYPVLEIILVNSGFDIDTSFTLFNEIPMSFFNNNKRNSTIEYCFEQIKSLLSFLESDEFQNNPDKNLIVIEKFSLVLTYLDFLSKEKLVSLLEYISKNCGNNELVAIIRPAIKNRMGR